MKKTLALLMLAAMLVSTGCGNNTMQGAKQDAQEAAAKVDQAKQAAEAKVDQAKQEATATVNEAAQEAAATVNQATQNLAGGSANGQGRTIALEGLRPGMSLDEARNMFGEARPIDEDGYIFNNGVVIDMNDFGRIEEIKVMQAGLRTPEGIEVGTPEATLKERCGAANEVEFDDGATEYKYFSGDGASKIEYTVRGGVVAEIKCSLRD